MRVPTIACLGFVVASGLAVADKPAKPPADTTLRLTSLDPSKGDAEGGAYVRLTGNAFLTPARKVKVYFGATQGTLVRTSSDTEMIVQAPGGKPGDVVDVRVVFEPGGELTLAKAFTFVKR